MRRALAMVALVLGGSPAACAFLLDFDELQAENGGSGGQDGGSDGSGCNCVTTDPCNPQVCQPNGKCEPEPFVGLAPDGYSAVLSAPQVHRITLASLVPAFYGSVFYDDDGPRLRFFKIGFDETADAAPLPGGKLSTDLGAAAGLASLASAVPAGAAGLTAAGAQVLAGFGASNGDVFALQLNSALEVVLPGSGVVGAQYAVDDPTRHVQVWVRSPTAHLGWITNEGKVHVPALTTEFGSGNVDAFAPLLTGGGVGVVFQENGVFVQHQDQAAPIQLAECAKIQPWTHFTVSNFGLEGASAGGNVALFTKTDGVGWALQSEGVSCTANACNPDPDIPVCDQPVDNLLEDVRTISALAFQIVTQPPEKFYQVVVTGRENAGTRHILLSATEYDGVQKTQEAIGPAIALTESLPSAEGPDWPTIAFSGLDKVLVGWTEHSGGAGSAHVRRFKLCLPPPTN